MRQKFPEHAITLLYGLFALDPSERWTEKQILEYAQFALDGTLITEVHVAETGSTTPAYENDLLSMSRLCTPEASLASDFESEFNTTRQSIKRRASTADLARPDMAKRRQRVGD